MYADDLFPADQAPFLPRVIETRTPPLKTQGIKTAQIGRIAEAINWAGDGRWIEPFAGSAVVAFNLAPKRAVLADTNHHIIGFYSAIQNGAVTANTVRTHLEREGTHLNREGERHYYRIRERFNETGEPHDFLFLNRACFNGVMRFNRSGQFNVPFCRKPDRFRPSMITRIVNQVSWVQDSMRDKDWEFVVADWRDTVLRASKNDLVYCDPPYVGRHTDYLNRFSTDDAEQLARTLIDGDCPFALSMWLENRYRKNHYVEDWFTDQTWHVIEHEYFVGSYERYRNRVTEVLILSSEIA